MYTYVKAVALSRAIGSQWKEIDLSTSPVIEIYRNYTKTYLVLANVSLPDNVYVDLDSLKAEFSAFSGTITQLLSTLGTRTLDTVPSLPTDKVAFVKYSDALRVGYKTTLAKAGMIYPEAYPESELPDLCVERPLHPVDMKLVNDYCLMSVNGYYHWTEATTEKAFVYNGAVTMRKSKINHIGLLNFIDVGKLTKIKIEPSNVQRLDASTPLKDKILFTVPDNLDNKSYVLILGGYIVLPEDGTFWRSGDNSFTLSLQKLDYVERLLESSQYLDLTALGLSHFSMNPDALSVSEIMSDEVIRRYMTLSQSFLVLVDTPNLASNKIHVRHSSLPGMFTTYQKPEYPLIVNYGKVAEYWITEEDGHWALSVQDSFLRNYIVSQQPVKSIQAITGQLLPNQPYYHSRGYFLELIGYKI